MTGRDWPKKIVEKIPLWLIFLLVIGESSTLSMLFAIRGDAIEAIVSLVMALVSSVCLGVELMDRKYKKQNERHRRV